MIVKNGIKKKFINKKTIKWILVISIYIGFYALLRQDHHFVHACYYSGSEKVGDSVHTNMTRGLAFFFLNWYGIALINFIDIIYKPLMILETLLHHLNLLPSSCPWK